MKHPSIVDILTIPLDVIHCLLQPVYLHGSLGREAATGRGVVVATSELMKHMDNGKIEGKTIVIQVVRMMPVVIIASERFI